MTKLYLLDVTLRDGMHAINHRFTLDQVRTIAAALDEAGVDGIEVGHGDGLHGSTIAYGLSRHTDVEYIEAAASVVKRAKLTTVLLPGIGTIEDLRRARDAGIQSIRIATHSTEADVSRQHIEAAKTMGLDVAGFLMMSSANTPAGLAGQAALMESYGADAVYVADSAGAMTMQDIADRFSALRDRLRPETQTAIHAHENMSLSVANSVTAVQHGATRVDASLAGMGAGAGNTPIEAFVAVANKYGWEVGADLFRLQDAAEDLVRPIQDRPVRVDRETLTIGFANVYSSFLRHAERAAKTHDLDPRAVLMEIGRRRLIGGQEDMILDVALNLARAREEA